MKTCHTSTHRGAKTPLLVLALTISVFSSMAFAGASASGWPTWGVAQPAWTLDAASNYTSMFASATSIVSSPASFCISILCLIGFALSYRPMREKLCVFFIGKRNDPLLAVTELSCGQNTSSSEPAATHMRKEFGRFGLYGALTSLASGLFAAKRE